MAMEPNLWSPTGGGYPPIIITAEVALAKAGRIR